jgi:hypothetical protein
MFDLPLLLQKRDQTRQYTISTVLSDRFEKFSFPAGSAGRPRLEDKLLNARRLDELYGIRHGDAKRLGLDEDIGGLKNSNKS